LTERMGLLASVKNSSFWLIMVCQMISATTLYTMIQWMPTYMVALRHVSFRSMGGWLTVGYIVATCATLSLGYIADRTMQRTLTGACACLVFMVVVIPASLLLSPAGSAVALAALIAIPSSTAALNGALIHTMVQPAAIARATGVYMGTANIVSAIGPVLFGFLVSRMEGQFWGGFLFLAILNAIGLACYLTLHRIRENRAGVGDPAEGRQYVAQPALRT